MSSISQRVQTWAAEGVSCTYRASCRDCCYVDDRSEGDRPIVFQCLELVRWWQTLQPASLVQCLLAIGREVTRR